MKSDQKSISQFYSFQEKYYKKPEITDLLYNRIILINY
jgi:hypothetical protein